MPAGSRIRANNVYGTVENNPLLIGATSFTSQGLNLLPAISGNHAVVVLDPKRVFGPPEIVVVTSHLALGTTATITRGAYGTSAREHPQDTAWAHVPVGPDDYIAVATSLARPSDPYEGQFIYETDTNKLVGYGGTDWAPRDAGGMIGYSEIVADQTGFVIGADTPIPGLSAAVTVGTGRRIKITSITTAASSTSSIIMFTSIKEGVTVLNYSLIHYMIAGNQFTIVNTRIFTPTAGAHTYTVGLNATSGTLTAYGGNDRRTYLLVEDIGAA